MYVSTPKQNPRLYLNVVYMWCWTPQYLNNLGNSLTQEAQPRYRAKHAKISTSGRVTLLTVWRLELNRCFGKCCHADKWSGNAVSQEYTRQSLHGYQLYAAGDEMQVFGRATSMLVLGFNLRNVKVTIIFDDSFTRIYLYALYACVLL